MSRRRRTCPPPDSMAGTSSFMLLGLVGFLGVSLVSVFLSYLSLGLGGLSLLDRLILHLCVLDRLFCRRRCRDDRLLGLRRRHPARPLSLGRHGLLPHQFDDRHRRVVALAVLDLDDPG